MNAAPHRAPTGCPGLFHIVAARDGGLCRIKLARGELSATQAEAIAAASRHCASGIVDVTNRANLQLRGVRENRHDALIQALLDAGLGPLDGERGDAAARDDRRNVMLSPTAGIDAQALLDTRPLADALSHALQAEARFDALSPKFALLLDGGEALAEREHPHDIWLAASSPSRLVFGLADAPAHRAALGTVAVTDAVGLVLALVHAFLDLRQDAMTRMRDLLGAVPITELLACAHRHGARAEIDRPAYAASIAPAALRFGLHPQRASQRVYLGAQPPLGRMDADMLDGLASLARSHGASHLRMTPWQGVLLPDIPLARADDAMARLRHLGLLCDPREPLTHMVACAGSTGCARSLADTKADARRLADHGVPPGLVHLSGCSRSCAAAVPADYTLLAVAPGRYDIHRRDATTGFGPRIASAQTLSEAAVLLKPGGEESVHA